MNILIDGLSLYLNLGQIGDYSRLMIDNMIKYTDLNLKIIKDYEIESNKYSNCRVDLLIDRVNGNSSSLINYINLNNIDFFHCLNNGFSIPKNYNFNYIINVCNLMPLFIEELCNPNYLSNFFNKFPYSILQTDYIICPSMSCKRDLLEHFSMNDNKVIVNYGFLSNFFRPQDKFMSSIYINSKFNIKKQYIFFYGDFHKRKNLDKVILLFNNLKRYVSDLILLICCDNFNDKDYLDDLKNLSNKLNISNEIIFLHNLNLLDKLNLLNNALFFIDLSNYENVNLNIVNAFNMEIPIICSPIPLYKEYLGDNAFYIFDNIKEDILLDYVLSYTVSNKDFVLSKFDTSINLDIILNIYNKFNT